MYETTTQMLVNHVASPFEAAIVDGLLLLYHEVGSEAFPVEAIPDGDVGFPHHFWHGIFGAIIGLFAVRYESRRPWVTFAGVALAVYGWVFLWGNAVSPFLGALFSLVGVTGAIVAVVLSPYWRAHTRSEYRTVVVSALRSLRSDPREAVREAVATTLYPVANPLTAVRRVTHNAFAARWRLVTLVSLLVAADDVYDHALPITSVIERYWVNSGHGQVEAITRVAVNIVDWLINVFLTLV